MVNYSTFLKLLKEARILDYNYPVRGDIVWLPYGVKLMQLFKENIISLIEKEGYEGYDFPILMQGTYLRQVSKKVSNFLDNVFWIKDKDLFIKPTGEYSIYPMFHRWIKTQKDLPLRIYQIGSFFRPIKNCDKLFNLQERHYFFEGHVATKNEKECEEEFNKAKKINEDIFRLLAIPVLKSERPLSTNKPVSKKTIGYDTLLSINKTLQVGAVYLQSDIYSKIFDIKFTDKDNQKKYTHQITWGSSERLIFASLMSTIIKGELNIIPRIAPYQIVIIPIIKKGKSKEINSFCEKLNKKIISSGFSSYIDYSEIPIGKKFHEWGIKGIPLRIDIGDKEIKEKKFSIYSKYLEVKETYSFNELSSSRINQFLNKIEENMIKTNEENFKKKIKTIQSIKEIKEKQKDYPVLKFPLDYDSSLVKKIEKDYSGEILGFEKNILEEKCIFTGKFTNYLAYFSRRI